MGWDGMGWDVMRWGGVGCDEMQRKRKLQDVMGHYAMRCAGVGWDAMRWGGVGWDAMKQDEMG